VEASQQPSGREQGALVQNAALTVADDAELQPRTPGQQHLGGQPQHARLLGVGWAHCDHTPAVERVTDAQDVRVAAPSAQPDATDRPVRDAATRLRSISNDALPEPMITAARSDPCTRQTLYAARVCLPLTLLEARQHVGLGGDGR
jgi:hypothetical protein